MNLTSQLIDFYYQHDKFQEPILEPEQVEDTIKVLMSKDRLCYQLDNLGNLSGYIESWRINFEQLGRLICHHNNDQFDVWKEDIQTGNICYLANITIRPDCRKTYAMADLADKFFKQNADAEYFVGHAQRKKTQPIKVFKASELSRIKQLFVSQGGELNGS